MSDYTLPETIETTLHHYSFDVALPGDREEYDALRARLKATPGRGRWMNAISMDRPNYPTGTVHLETRHLFSNQWNTEGRDGENGFRVFDWYEEVNRNPNLKAGHWLEITPEMIEAREKVEGCGFCGKQYGPRDRETLAALASQNKTEAADALGLSDSVPPAGFCAACIGSQYLGLDEMHLLRLVPVCVDRFSAPAPPLTDEEREALEPVYRSRQASREAEDVTKERAAEILKAEKQLASAQVEHDGKMFFLDRGLSCREVIYYSHTQRFRIGWRDPVPDEVAARFLEVLSEFPWVYEIKTDPDGKHGGRTLENH